MTEGHLLVVCLMFTYVQKDETATLPYLPFQTAQLQQELEQERTKNHKMAKELQSFKGHKGGKHSSPSASEPWLVDLVTGQGTLNPITLLKNRQFDTLFSRVLRNSTPRFVGPSVGPSVRPSVSHTLLFRR